MQDSATAATGRISAQEALGRLFDVSAALFDLVNKEAGAQGISPARSRVLWTLRRTGAVPMRELAEALAVTPRTVTGLVDGLEADGWVSRRAAPDDRRVTLVELSPEGTAVCTELETSYQGWSKKLFQGISQTDLGTLVAILDQLGERIARDPKNVPSLGASQLTPLHRPIG